MAETARGHYVWKVVAQLCSCPDGDFVESPYYRTGHVKWNVRITKIPSPISSDTQKFKVFWKSQIPEYARQTYPEIHYTVAMYFESPHCPAKKIFSVSAEEITSFSFTKKFYITKTDYDDLMQNDDAFRFEVNISNEVGIALSSQSYIGDLKSASSSLGSDFATHVQKQDPDVTLRSADGVRTFPAHRLLLTVRSEVFQRMLSTDMLENLIGDICLPDLTSLELELLVDFLYGREVKPTFLTAQLYQAAHTYALPDLLRLCSQGLVRGLSVAGVCKTAALAHLHADAGLFEESRTFILDNAAAVMVSDGYIRLLQRSPDVAVALAQWDVS